MSNQSSFPEIVVNVACSLDGIIASRFGPLELSNKEDWIRVHTLRNNSDAILVGVNTVLKDNPGLKVKKVEFTPPHPFRVVLDTHAKIPLDAKVVNEQEQFPTILFTSSTDKHKLEILTEKGVFVEQVCLDEEGFLDLVEVLSILRQKYNVKRLMVEGGGKVIVSFLRQKLVDKLYIFYAPLLVGSEEGIPLFPFKTKTKITEQDRFKELSVKKLGDGFLVKINLEKEDVC